MYALDVTTPASFGTGNVKWERSSTSATPASDNMGLVLGKPVLAKVRNGTSTSAVVLGNGINSGSDKAVLLVLNMDDGSVIREIPTDSTTSNGLFAPTGIYAADGKTLVYAYAGRPEGQCLEVRPDLQHPGLLVGQEDLPRGKDGRHAAAHHRWHCLGGGSAYQPTLVFVPAAS